MASESQDQFNISSERLSRPLGEHSLLASLTPDRNLAFSKRPPIHILTKHNPASLQLLVCRHPQNVGNSSTCLAKHLKPTAAVSQIRGYIQIQMQPRNAPFISLAIKEREEMDPSQPRLSQGMIRWEKMPGYNFKCFCYKKTLKPFKCWLVSY